MPFQFEIPIHVQESDFDEMDHINNAVYLVYAEQIARAHANAVGLSWDDLQRMGHAFVVRRHEVEYHCPANRGDILRARTRITRIRGPRAVRHVQILRGDELVVDIKTDWIWVNLETRYPVRIPAEVSAIFPSAND